MGQFAGHFEAIVCATAAAIFSDTQLDCTSDGYIRMAELQLEWTYHVSGRDLQKTEKVLISLWDSTEKVVVIYFFSNFSH